MPAPDLVVDGVNLGNCDELGIDGPRDLARVASDYRLKRGMLPEQIDQAILIGEARQEYARANGVKDRRKDKNRDSLAVDIEGAIGEGAVASWLGSPVFAKWFAHMIPGGVESGKPDVGLFHVRACRPGRGLIVKDSDPTNAAYVLVHVMPDRTARIIGWAFGFEVKQERHRRRDWSGVVWCMPARKVYGLDGAREWHLSKLEELKNGKRGSAGDV